MRRADLGALLHGHEDDRLDDRQPDGRHDAQRQRADQRVLVREVALERVYRQQREVGLVAGMAHEVHVDELLELEVRHRDVLHNIGEEATWRWGLGSWTGVCCGVWHPVPPLATMLTTPERQGDRHTDASCGDEFGARKFRVG